jgi:hypothetical protein
VKGSLFQQMRVPAQDCPARPGRGPEGGGGEPPQLLMALTVLDEVMDIVERPQQTRWINSPYKC